MSDEQVQDTSLVVFTGETMHFDCDYDLDGAGVTFESVVTIDRSDVRVVVPANGRIVIVDSRGFKFATSLMDAEELEDTLWDILRWRTGCPDL